MAGKDYKDYKVKMIFTKDIKGSLNLRELSNIGLLVAKKSTMRLTRDSLTLTIRDRDNSENFINLFGMSIEPNSGDIALGINPNRYVYIYLGNLYEIIGNIYFGSKDIDSDTLKAIKSYYKNLLEGFKIRPFMTNKRIYDFINQAYEYSKDPNDKHTLKKYDSIILNLAKNVDYFKLMALNMKKEGNIAKQIYIPNSVNSHLCKIIENYEGLYNLACTLMDMYYDCLRLSTIFYPNIGIEDTNANCFNKRTAYRGISNYIAEYNNVNNLSITYVYNNIKTLFLDALLSYALNRSQHTEMLEFILMVLCMSRGKYDGDTKIKLSKFCIQSAYYFSANLSLNDKVDLSSFDEMSKQLDISYKKDLNKLFTFNLMDMLRVGRKDMEIYHILFGYVKSKNKSDISIAGQLLNDFLKKYKIDKYLFEDNIPVSDFIKYVKEYLTDNIAYYDTGYLAKKDRDFEKYRMFPCSLVQLRNSGDILNGALDRIKSCMV